MAFKALSKKSAGPLPTGTNAKILIEFKKFYNDEFKELINNDELDGSLLSRINDHCATSMLTCIENNIKMHFLNHLRKFVNQMFKNELEEILSNLKGKEREKKKRELNNELRILKDDLIGNTKICNNKYHLWLDTYRHQILPSKFTESYTFDIKDNPQKYLEYMINMNIILEKKELKQFQFFPLRTDITSKYISIETKTLVELFIKKNKNEYLTNIEKYKNELWNKYFKMSKKIFRMKYYTFDFTILTNGYSTSVRFLHESFVESEKKKKANMVNLSKIAKKNNKNLSNDEKIRLKDKKTKEKKEADTIRKLRHKINKQIEKIGKKKLTKEEKEEIEEERKIELEGKTKEEHRRGYNEFPYLDELIEDDLEEVKIKKKIYIDPGKRSLFYMTDDYNNILNYSNRRRLRETKRLKYTRLRENYKKKNPIFNKEKEMNKYNSKTCNYDKFKEYIKHKYILNKELFESYNNVDYFKKLNWYSYMNTKRSESKLINLIKETYGSDIIIIIGDWSIRKQMRNFISTPNLTLKRVLSREFKVYNFDEYRTSCLNYKTEERCKNLYLPDRKNRMRKMHAILTYQLENNRLGCINRDRNGVYNIRKLVHHYLKTGERLSKYRRGTKLDENELSNKNDNQNKNRLEHGIRGCQVDQAQKVIQGQSLECSTDKMGITTK